MTARAIELALRAYPTGYRELHGAELAATADQVGEAEGGLAVLQEASALAAHGLRVRLRISPDRPLGRALNRGAPLAVAVDTAVRLGILVTLLRTLTPMLSWEQLQQQFALWPAITAIGLSLLALTGLALGRWQLARLLSVAACGVAAVAAVLTQLYADSHGGGSDLWASNFVPLAGTVLSTLLLLAAPLSLEVTNGRRAGAIVLLAVGTLALETLLFDQARFILTAVLLLGVALLSSSSYRRNAVVVVLALLPATLYPLYDFAQGAGIHGPQFQVGMAAALAVAGAGLLRTRRRTAGTAG